ncbi:hypothetical protein K492DRAFT_238327 [Lichtheimia hyalospora FSU 10163]|nr:hypothetical protein K492DRAFT_238327 [Lichtheimia hyalospora FSU 10163]
MSSTPNKVDEKSSSNSSSSSMQTWLQVHLENYVELGFLNKVPDTSLSLQDDDFGSVLACLAHRFCPSSVPDLVTMLQQENVATTAIQIFHNELDIPNDIPHNEYLDNIRHAVDEKQEPTEQSMRLTETTLVTETQHIQVTRRTREYSSSDDEEFERHVSNVLHHIHQLRTQLNDMTLMTSSSSSAQRHHETEEKINQEDDMAVRVDQFEKDLAQFENQDMKAYRTYVSNLGDEARAMVATRIQAVDAAYAALEVQLEDDFKAIRTGVLFSKLTLPIRHELETVQAKMLKTTTTEDGIRELEERTQHARHLLDTMEKEYGDAMLNTKSTLSYRSHFNALRQKHQVVCSWVDEVRVWFVEAERIRRWIEERIELIEKDALADPVQTLSLQYSLEQVDEMTTRHEAMEKEVDQFDHEDMTRLRAHVKALTGVDKQQDDKDLSPADTTTIEITFTTLMTLDRLMHMLRKRSYELQMLTLRVFWEQEHAASDTWVAATDTQVDTLLARARWQLDEEKTMSWAEADTLKNNVVRELLDVEQRIADFDQGQFTTAVNMYQDMDNHSKVELPAHLESRQVALEEAFEALTKRVSYARQVVEQRITVVDFVYRADDMINDGGRLKEEMAIAEQQAVVGDSDREFMDRIRQFQEQAVQLVTSVAVRIRYPEHVFPVSDIQANDDANAMIRSLISNRKSAVILFGDMLDQKLAAYQYVLEMITTADQLHRELRHMHDLIENQIKSIAQIKDDVLGARCPLTHQDADKLTAECKSQRIKLDSLREGDVKIMRDALDALRKDVIELNASAVPINRLDGAMERLEQLLKELESLLALHEQELFGLEARLQWKDAWSEAMQQITTLTQDVWELVGRIQWRVDTVEPGNMDIQHMETAYTQRQQQIEDFKQANHLDTVTSLFSTMMNAIENMVEKMPEHFQRRQDSLNKAFEELTAFFDFARHVLDQHKALAKFSSESLLVQQNGSKLIEDLEVALRNVMDEDMESSLYSEPIQHYNQRVQDLLTTLNDNPIPYPARPVTSATDAYRTSADHDYIHSEIRAFVQDHQDKLKQLHERMIHLESLYISSLEFKASIASCAKGAEELDNRATGIIQTILPDRQNLAVDTIHLSTAADPSVLKERHVENVTSTESIKAALDGLQKKATNIKESIQQSHVSEHVEVTMINAAMAKLDGNYQELIQLVEQHGKELDVYADRLDWEKKSNALLNQAHNLQEQLRNLDEEKKTLHLSSRIDNDKLCESQQRLCDLQQPLADILNMKRVMDEANDIMKNSYDTLLTQPVPQPVMGRHKDIHGLIVRVSDLADQLEKELDLIGKRQQWEHSADEVLASSLDLEQRLEEFIRNEARWQQTSELHHTIDLDSKFSEWKDAVLSQGENITKIRTTLDDLLDNQHLYRSDALSRRSHELQGAQDRLTSLLSFGSQVKNQHEQFAECIQQAEQLESNAEILRKQIEDGSNTEAELEQFMQKVEAFGHTACNISYPVRNFRGHDVRSRNQDNTANTVMQETLHVRQSRIEQLPVVLKAAVEAQQMQNEKNAAVETYMTESRNLKEWITSKLDSLDDVFALNNDSSVQDLRTAATTMDAIQSAVQANDTTFSSLGVKALKLEDDENVQKQHAELTQLWRTLAERLSTDAKDTLTTRLHAAEYNESTQQLSSQCQSIQSAMNDIQTTDLSETKLGEWRDEIDSLKTQLYETVGVQATNEAERETYKQLSVEHTKLLATLDDLNKKLRNRGLLDDYRTRTDAVATFFKDTTSRLDSLQQEYGIITGASDDENQCRLFNDEYNAIQRTAQEKMEEYREQQSFYRALQLQDIDTSNVEAEHEALENAQKALVDKLDTVRLAANLATQWKDLHATLRAVECESAKINDMNTEDDQQGDTKEIESQLAAMDARLATASAMSDKLSTTADNNISIQTDHNKQHFQDRYSKVCAAITEAKQQLELKKANAKERADLAAFVAAANKLKEDAEKERQRVQERTDGVAGVCHDIGQKQDTQSALEQQYRTRISSTAATEADVFDKLVEQCDELSTKPIMDDTVLSHARQAVDSLKQAIDDEKKINDMIRRALGHSKTADNINSWINNCRNAIETAAGDMELSDDKYIDEDVQDIKTKMDNFSSVVESFIEMTSKIMNDATTTQGSASDAVANEVVQVRAQRVDVDWKALQKEFADLQDAMTRTSKGIAIVRQMKRVLQLCGDARERVGRLESNSTRLTITGHALSNMLREQDVLAAQQELETIEEKVNNQVDQELTKLDEMLQDLENADDTFAQQRNEMSSAVSNLTTAMAEKKQQLGRALDVGRCLVITDDIEVLVSALEDAATKASNGNKENSKADLQARVIELDARYKYYERKIVQSLDAAQLAAGDITNDDDRELVLRHVRELRERWEIIDRQVQSQKAELNKSLAASRPVANRARKSSLPTRKASHFLRDRDRSPSRLPTSTSSSLHQQNNNTSLLLAASNRLAKSTSSSHVPPAPRPGGMSRSKLVPPSQRRTPSRSATNAKPPARPAIHVTPANKYVADPHNDLDMEIGRIVNETPYKIKVKMVPGEVGRYWFGDANPKLAYCRVLKSKMVMVRVGGGWMELTEFLRQHALLEGDFIPRSAATNAVEEQQEEHIPRIREGFIETRKQRQRIRERSPSSSFKGDSSSSSSTTLLSPPAPTNSSGSRSTPQNAQKGYIDGDRYITVDRYGNQLEVKMTKATMHQSSSSNTRRKPPLTQRNK